MAETTDPITNVGQLIDMSIVKFITHVQGMGFARMNTLVKQLEVEQARIQMTRKDLSTAKRKYTLEENKKRHELYISTYVIESKIIDRIEIANSLKKLKGVKFGVDFASEPDRSAIVEFPKAADQDNKPKA
jgi:hypothetical protein